METSREAVSAQGEYKAARGEAEKVALGEVGRRGVATGGSLRIPREKLSRKKKVKKAGEGRTRGGQGREFRGPREDSPQ